MLAAENGGLPGGKIGGMGDVVRDLPRALASRGHQVTVITPAYGFLRNLPGAEPCGRFEVPFAGSVENCRRFGIPSGYRNLHYEVFDSPRFSPGGEERIYHDDGPDAPFATDAGKFAFFSAAAARFLADTPDQPDVVHLHDWHTGLFFLLREFDPACRSLQTVRCVFTIHNLALQGVRPVRGDASSVQSWFPMLNAPKEVLDDPVYDDCVNPMAVAIRLADTVTTVSPTYATEILRPSDAITGRSGGESLEGILSQRDHEGALVGILNGCEYHEADEPAPSWKQCIATVEAQLAEWIAGDNVVQAAHYLADKRLQELPRRKPPIIATSIGRATDQKLGLFREVVWNKSTALDYVLKFLDKGVLIVLASGQSDHERFLQAAMVRHPNFIFLRGYSDSLAQMLYSAGDLFLMPSVFEPCGISQMLAMRAGQPVVAHSVGGLRDTISGENGFPFSGEDRHDQARNFVRAVSDAVKLKQSDSQSWEAIRQAARRERFTWDASAERYLSEVYGFDAESGVLDVNAHG